MTNIKDILVLRSQTLGYTRLKTNMCGLRLAPKSKINVLHSA